ncbi:MAG TPA: hypothetical protein VF407_05115 [Polyangiaceae bacterium]
MRRLALAIALFCTLLCGTKRAHAASHSTALGAPERLEVPGAPDAYYYRPRVRGQRPILMYLHGRGNNPAEDCRKWAKVGTKFGWVVCPQGPEDRGNGSRSWNNDSVTATKIIAATVDALRAKYKHRVTTRHNVLIGFSEGAFIAMQVGLHDPVHWDKWLILAANDQYWYGDTAAILKDDQRRVHRVYLLTGENDGVAENTKRVGDMLKAAKIPVRVRIRSGMGHEVPADKMNATYRRPLLWLTATK